MKAAEHSLRELVDNKHWPTIGWLYINADNGKIYSNLNEIPKEEIITTTEQKETTSTGEKESISTNKEQQISSLNSNSNEGISKESNTAVVSNNSTTKTPKTGDSSLTEIFVIFSAIAITGFISFAPKRKKA